jgi:hypothetical protein
MPAAPRANLARGAGCSTLRRVSRARRSAPARRRGAVGALAVGALVAASGCSMLFDEGGLRDDAAASAGKAGGAGAGGAGGGGAGGAGGGSGGGGSGGGNGSGGTFPGPRDAYGLVVLRDGPLAYYRFDDVRDDVVVSAVEGAPEGELFGLVEPVEPGAVGTPGDRALGFDGDGSLSIDESLGLRIDRAFAVEVWFSLDVREPQEACLVSAGDESDGGAIVTASLDPEGFATLAARVFDEDGLDVEIAFDLASSPEGFTYLLVSFDGSRLTLCAGEAGEFLSCEDADLPEGPLAPVSPPEILVGDSDVVAGCSLSGVVDELAFYDRPVRDFEARTHYAAGSPALPLPF